MVDRDTPIGKFVLIGNFRRRLARELLVCDWFGLLEGWKRRGADLTKGLKEPTQDSRTIHGTKS